MIDIKKEKTSEEKKPDQVKSEDVLIETEKESREITEVKEQLSAQEIQAAKEAIENMDLDEKLKHQTQSSAQDIKSLKEEEKIKKLLELARTKGVVYAIHTAKKMNDAYVLDILHDQLAKEGLYKKLTQ